MSENSTPLPPPVTAPPGRSRNGKATAAGVLLIIQGAVWLIGGIALLSFRTSDLGSWADDIAGGIITFLTIMVLLVGVLCLWVGISVLKCRNWARITGIVIGGLDLLACLPSFTSSDGITSGIVGVVWSGAIIYLSVNASFDN